MDQGHMQRMFDGGTKYNPIIIPIQITSVTTSGGATKYVKIPVGLRLLGAKVRCFGTHGGSVAVTINQGRVSTGSADDLLDDAEQMTAAELTAAGVVVTALTSPALFTSSPTAVNIVNEAQYAANYALTADTTFTTLGRAYGVMEADDVLIINVAATTTNAPIYHIDIYATAQ
jgi:hypothetical protein